MSADRTRPEKIKAAAYAIFWTAVFIPIILVGHSIFGGLQEIVEEFQFEYRWRLKYRSGK